MRAVLGPLVVLFGLPPFAACACQASAGDVTSAPPPPRQVKPVAVYVYAGLDEADMSPFARTALRQIETVGSSEQLDVVLELDDVGETDDGRYHLRGQAAPVEERALTTPPIARFPEFNSGSAATLSSFLSWAVTEYPAHTAVLLIMGHSWGWRGIIQDFGLPSGSTGEMTMIPVSEVRKALEEAVRLRGRPFDVVVLDACTTGVVEVAYELKSVARTLLASQLNTPLSSLAYEGALKRLAAGDDIESVLKSWTRDSVLAYARGAGDPSPRGGGGSDARRPGWLAEADEQFSPLSLVAVRLDKMDEFRRLWDAFAAALVGIDFRREFLLKPTFVSALVDEDFNVDVLDFLRLTEVELGARLPGLGERIGALRDLLDYRDDDGNATARFVELPTRGGTTLQLDLQADDLAPEDMRLIFAREAFEFMNKEYVLSRSGCEARLASDGCECCYARPPEIVLRDGRPYLRVALKVAPEREDPLRIRVRLPGATHYYYEESPGNWRKIELGPDYYIRDDFAPTGLYIAEGHTNGAYNINGLGLMLRARIDDTMPFSEDPTGHFSREEYYRQLKWNQESLWPTLLFGESAGPR